MKNVRSLIAEFLESADRDALQVYRANPLPLIAETGVILNEKSEEIVLAVYQDDFEHLAIKGPRGGGKTYLISKALACRFALKNDDVFHLGGSEEQAKAGFGYVSEFLYGHPELAEFLEDELKTAAKTKLGNWYKIAACSHKRVRGPHCGDPHREMGNVGHGGVCYTDEEAEIPDDIVDAVRFTINTAKPRKRVRSSTAHKVAGRFKQVTNNPKKYGAHLIEYDIIDVSEPCTHDCAKCPMGHYFAGAYLGGKPQNDRAARDLFPQTRFNGKSIPALPLPTKESIAAWEEWKQRNQFPSHEPAICEGRAKLHRPGHKSMESLFQEVKESQNRDSDDQEMFGRTRQGGGSVINGAALEACLGDYGYKAGAGEVTATFDWGWNWTVMILWQEQNCLLVPIEVHYLHHMRIGEVAELLKQKAKEYGIWQAFADSSHKHENAEIAAEGYELHEVAFKEWKDFGVRWLCGIIQRRELGFPGEILEPEDAIGAEGKYRFPSEGHRKLFEQMLGWKTGSDGKIVKANDHGPDSSICLSMKFHGDSVAWNPDIEGTGVRDSVKDAGVRGGDEWDED